MDISQLGNSPRIARIKRRHSQEQASGLCGSSKKALGKIERAQADINVEAPSKLEGGLRISLEALVSGPSDTDYLSGSVEYFPVLEPCSEPGHPFTYGMMAYRDTPKGLYPLTSVHDISTDPALVIAIAKDFATYGLSPLHLFDAILDRIP